MTLDQLLVVNDKLRLNEKPESESRVAEEFEVVRNAGNVQTLSVSKNTTVATCEYFTE